MTLIRGNDAARFESKIERTETCWLWHGTVTDKGYGHFWLDGRMVSAHRRSYELYVGEIPEGLTLDHLCRVRRCVNPDHLEPVSNRENVLRGASPPALQAAQEACHRGHPFDEANTYRWRNSRQCRACRKFINRGARSAA
jgi:hypothetical protein